MLVLLLNGGPFSSWAFCEKWSITLYWGSPLARCWGSYQSKCFGLAVKWLWENHSPEVKQKSQQNRKQTHKWRSVRQKYRWLNLLLNTTLDQYSSLLHQHISSVHQYINSSVHQYINTSVHQYISTSVHQYINTSVHQYISTSVHQYIRKTTAHQYINNKSINDSSTVQKYNKEVKPEL